MWLRQEQINDVCAPPEFLRRTKQNDSFAFELAVSTPRSFSFRFNRLVIVHSESRITTVRVELSETRRSQSEVVHKSESAPATAPRSAGVYSKDTAGAYDAHPRLRFVEFDHFLITDI